MRCKRIGLDDSAECAWRERIGYSNNVRIELYSLTAQLRVIPLLNHPVQIFLRLSAGSLFAPARNYSS